MSPATSITKIEATYEHIWAADGGQLVDRLSKRLSPRSASLMYELVAEFGLGPTDAILDVGCGRGNHTGELAHRFGACVVGLDLVTSNLRQAQAKVVEAGLTDQVTLLRGNIESMPLATATFDLIWCRAMLVHVHNLAQAFRECARLLKPEGAMIVYTTFATGLLAPDETARLYEPLQVVAENMSRPRVEAAFSQAGLEIGFSEAIGSEFMERKEELDGRCSTALMRVAKMRRGREQFVAELGQARYEVLLAAYHWLVYVLLGKLSPTIYTLRKATGRQEPTSEG